MKKGFTLIELLAVIVIIAVIGLIVTPIVLTNIEKSRVSSYRTSVQNVMEASKEYVSKNYDNNDFPESGINIKKIDLGLKHDDLKSGKIIRNKDEEIEAVNVYNGTYCAKGLKNNLIVEKVNSEKDCNNIDSSAPRIRKLIVSNKTNNTITVMTILEVGETNIKEYEYCIGDDCKVSKEKSFKFTGLKKDTEYLITVKVRNNNYKKSEQYTDEVTESIEKIKTRTENVSAPKIKVSSISYAGSKKVIINYSKIKDKHENKYFIYDDKNNKILEENTDKNEISFNVTQNGKVVAQTLIDHETYESELKVIGIDNEGPTYEIRYYNDDSNWAQSKTVEIINVKDNSILAKNRYSFDGGKTWTSSNKKTYKKNQILTIVVRDKLGNKTTKTFNVDKVDRTAPTCSLKVTSGVAGNNGWYRSNVTIDFNSITENQSGVKSSKIDKKSITSEGTTNIFATVVDNVGNVGTCSLNIKIDKTNPSCVSSGGSTSWTNVSRTLLGVCSDSLSKCAGNASWLINWEGNWTNLSPGKVYDKAGNYTECPANQTVRVEKKVSAPKIAGQNITNNEPIIIYVYEGSSAISGINRYQYSVDDGNWADLVPVWTDKWPTFDAPYYFLLYGDLQNAFGTNAQSLYNHFVNNGMSEGRIASSYFNVSVYKNTYGDLQNAFGNNLPSYFNHYINYGQREGRVTGSINWLRTGQVISNTGLHNVKFRAISNAGNVSAASNNQTTAIRVYSQSDACPWNNCLYKTNDCYSGYENGKCIRWPLCEHTQCGTFECNCKDKEYCDNWGAYCGGTRTTRCENKCKNGGGKVKQKGCCAINRKCSTCTKTCRKSVCGKCESHERVFNSCIGKVETCHEGRETCWHT